MYEGKNIHYSSTDSKLLCSFSGKLCNQRRLNGYGFCIRHILEDPSAPFKRCAYVAKSSNQMCTQAIPKHEERRYCNNHMQVLGMLPKKERKKKDKPSTNSEIKTPQINSGAVKTKFSLSNSKDNNTPTITVKTATGADDPDDPYAFSDTGPTESKLLSPAGNTVLSSDSILGKSLQSGQGFVRSPNDISSSSGLMTGGSMIAKYYPELAEKLEKMRAKPEPKLTPKSRARSSRTMNKLQTKIAQNKINEKLRKSQEHSHTDSNSSPLQLSSPEQSFGFEHSPSPGSGFSPTPTHTFSPQAATHSYTGSLNISRYDQNLTTHDIPPLPQVDTSLLVTLAAQDNLGFQNSGLLDPAMTSEKHLVSHTPPRLPPPYPGSSSISLEPPVSALNRQANLNNVLESLNSSQSSRQSTITQVGPSGPSSIATLSLNTLQSHHTSLQGTSSSASSYLLTSSPHTFPSTPVPNYLYSTPQVTPEAQLSGLKQTNHMTSSLPPNVDILSLFNINSKLGIDSAQPVMLPSPNTLAAHLSLPPPPPYQPPAALQKATVNVNVPPKPSPSSAVVTKASVPFVKLNKLSGIITDKEAKQKLKSDLAVNFYSFYAKRKASNHFLIGPNLCSSDEDTEDEDSDILPWQRDVYSASSDEEADSDELENDVPMGMRPTKISLLKTRLRRQWCQARSAYKMNSLTRKNNNQATLALIRTVRDSAACAVRALWQITHVKKSKRKLIRKLTKKKVCCNKSEKEGQCQNLCLPYTNHCIKHITYNINQQLFDFCTAKFANNVQCCLPSFDLRHELPLCQEHAAKADNYQKQLELENKKKPRKKTKPPALTRPPRKGKKKKKGRYSKAAQKPLPPPVSIGLDSTLSDVDVTSIDTSKPEENLLIESPSSAISKENKSTSLSVNQPTLTNFTSQVKHCNKTLDHALDLADALSPDFDKPFELPLEQASRLLDESDFQEVVNKMPFDELDLFGKNGEPDQDTDHLCIDSANKARDALEKLLSGPMSEEESMQLAMVLAQNLSNDAELAHNASLITDALNSAASQNDSRLLSGTDISINSHMNETAGLVSVSAGVEHHIIDMQSSNASDSSPYDGLHTTFQHPSVVQQPHISKPLQIGSYGLLDSSKMISSSHEPAQPKTISSTVASIPTMDGLSSVLTADLNAVYGQIESLSRSQLAAKKSTGLNLQHIAGLDSNSKTVMHHLTTDSQPTSSSSSIYIVPSPGEFLTSQIMNSNSTMSQIQTQLNTLDVPRSNARLEAVVTTQGFNATSLPVHTRSLSQHQNFTLYSPSSQSSQDMSYSLSLPSPAKKTKLDITNSEAPQTVQQKDSQQKQPQHLLNQQGSATVKNFLQTSSISSSKLTLPETSRKFRSHEIKSPASPKSSSPSSIQRLTLPSGQDSFLSSYSQKPSDNIKLKLPSTVLPESNQNRLNKTESLTTFQILNSATSGLSPLTVNTIRYSLNSVNTCNITSSQSIITTTTSRRHNLLEDNDNGASESISVTVRHPSPLESVPTTVRHTLPDTFPTPMTLPSSPALSLAIKSSSQSSVEQQKLVSGTQWASPSPMGANLQNGLGTGASSSSHRAAHLTHKFSPAGQGVVRTKQNTTAAEVARITALANAAGVPVVCSPVSLPALVQNLSNTTFKSSGSS